MSKIISIGVAQAPFVYSQNEIKDFIQELYMEQDSSVKKLVRVFDNASIDRRHFIKEKEWYLQRRGFKVKNALYIDESINLCTTAISDCLDGCGLAPQDIDHIVFVSSTGISTPSLDARLANILGFKPEIKRTPVWGLGCLGGVSGLRVAHDYLQAYTEQTVLVVAVEICSLAFQKDSFSKKNIVASALFSDGASAALVAGKEHGLSEKAGLDTLSSASILFPDSLDIMGWEVLDDGFMVVFSKDIPNIVKQNSDAVLKQSLHPLGLDRRDITHWVVHPGGAKVLDAFETTVGLNEGNLKRSRRVLRDHGNMSSPTVLFVLKRLMDEIESGMIGDFGLMTALGPGFSSETIVFQVR